ncbi:unnamed protein product [Lampetra fluviatilis]
MEIYEPTRCLYLQQLPKESPLAGAPDKRVALIQGASIVRARFHELPPIGQYPIFWGNEFTSPQAALGVRDSCKRLRAHTGAKKALAGKMGFPGALRCGQQGGPLAPCHSHCIKITSVVLKKKTSP